MFLDKLWVRIKGGILALKEDLDSDGELREKAEAFLDKLERRLERDDREPTELSDYPSRLDRVRKKMEAELSEAREAARSSAETTRRRSPSDGEIHEAWEELVRLRNEKQAKQQKPESSSANPRKLG